MTSRAFRDDAKIPCEHIEMVLAAARHGPLAQMPNRGTTSTLPITT
jgi:hypothetical protein